MKLYDFTYSGNAYKVRLMLSFLGQPYDTQIINLAEGEQQQPEFLAINPAGKVPVIVDGDTTVTDSNAILAYLAKKAKRGSGSKNCHSGDAGSRRQVKRTGRGPRLEKI